MPEWHPSPFQGPLPAFINKVLLKYSHVHLFMSVTIFVIKITEILWFITAYGSKPKIFTIWLFSGEFYWSLILLFSHSVTSDSLGPHGLQHTRPPCPPTPRVYSNSWPSSQLSHPTISSSVILFSSRLQSFPASGSFHMSQLFASSAQSIGVWASPSVLPINI